MSWIGANANLFDCLLRVHTSVRLCVYDCVWPHLFIFSLPLSLSFIHIHLRTQLPKIKRFVREKIAEGKKERGEMASWRDRDERREGYHTFTSSSYIHSRYSKAAIDRKRRKRSPLVVVSRNDGAITLRRLGTLRLLEKLAAMCNHHECSLVYRRWCVPSSR